MEQRGRDARALDGVRDEAIAWLARLRSDPSAQDQDLFETWYAADPRHADSYDALLDSWEAMQLASEAPAAHRARARPSRSWTKAAAAAAVILALALSLFLVGNPVLAPDAMLTTGIGEIRTVTLDDGSRVTLDTDSRLRVDLDRAERRLFLERGRARFEVAHDARRPFVVAAGASEVVAHGTVFDVDLRQPRAVVSLLQGSVEVRQPPTSGAATKSTVLRPGQRLATAGGVAKPTPAPIQASELRWPSGMLSFENAPLAEVVASANRYSRTRIVVSDPSIGERRFTGTIKAGDPRQLADMIGSMAALAVETDGAGNLVLAARK